MRAPRSHRIRTLATLGVAPLLILLAPALPAQTPPAQTPPAQTPQTPPPAAEDAALGMEDFVEQATRAPEQAARIARVVSVDGEVQVFTRKEIGWETVAKGRWLLEYEVLRTGPLGSAHVQFMSNGRTVKMSPKTFLPIPPKDGSFFPPRPIPTGEPELSGL
jgi:hypothetical protein